MNEPLPAGHPMLALRRAVDDPKGAIKSTATDQVRTVRLECELVAVGPMTEDEAASVATFGDLRRFEVIEGGVDPGR
jgi:hypothetical protein